MHPMMNIVFAPLTIAFLPLRFQMIAKEPAATGKPKAMNIIFQPQTPQLGPKQKVNPIVTNRSPNNKEIPAPGKKPAWDSSCGCESSLLSVISFTLTFS